MEARLMLIHSETCFRLSHAGLLPISHAFLKSGTACRACCMLDKNLRISKESFLKRDMIIWRK